MDDNVVWAVIFLGVFGSYIVVNLYGAQRYKKALLEALDLIKGELAVERQVAKRCAEIAEDGSSDYPGAMASGLSLRQWIASKILKEFDVTTEIKGVE